MTEHKVKPLYSWRAAICDSDLRPAVRHVALAMSLYMSERGDSAFPGAKRLAHDTGLTERAVRTLLGDLAAAGWLELVARGGLKGGKRMANLYRATIPNPGLPFTHERGSPVNGDARTPDPERADPRTRISPCSIESPRETIGAAGAGRERDLLWDAIVEACGIDPQAITKGMRGEIAAAVKALRDVNADPAEVPARARSYGKMMSSAVLSPSALAKWWPTLAGRPVLLASPVREVCARCNRYTQPLIECPDVADDCPVTFGSTLGETVAKHPAAGAN